MTSAEAELPSSQSSQGRTGVPLGGGLHGGMGRRESTNDDARLCQVLQGGGRWPCDPGQGVLQAENSEEEHLRKRRLFPWRYPTGSWKWGWDLENLTWTERQMESSAPVGALNMTPRTRDFHVDRQGQHVQPSAPSAESCTEERKGVRGCSWQRGPGWGIGHRLYLKKRICLGMEETWNNLGDGPTR